MGDPEVFELGVVGQLSRHGALAGVSQGEAFRLLTDI